MIQDTSNSQSKYNKYADNLDRQFSQVQKLVETNAISPKFAAAILAYLIRKDASTTIKGSLDQIINNSQTKKDRLLMFCYDHKRTQYI